MNTWRYLCAELYAWTVSAFFGAILIDIVYSRIVSGALPPSQATAAFSGAADLLLFISMLSILLALPVIGLSWNIGAARNLFIASVLCTVVIEYLTPMLFFSLFQMSQAELGLNAGPSVRLIGSTLASILAFAGLWKLSRSAS